MPRFARSKLIDTSALVDGRIEVLVKSGILEGQLLITSFVLNEMQVTLQLDHNLHRFVLTSGGPQALADSASTERRQRGRRGLDVLQVTLPAPDPAPSP